MKIFNNNVEPGEIGAITATILLVLAMIYKALNKKNKMIMGIGFSFVISFLIGSLGVYLSREKIVNNSMRTVAMITSIIVGLLIFLGLYKFILLILKEKKNQYEASNATFINNPSKYL